MLSEDAKKTVKEWLAIEPDRERRAVEFAGALREDWLRGATPAMEGRYCAYQELFREFIYEGIMRVNWRLIAGELLERFSPKLLAGYVGTPSVN